MYLFALSKCECVHVCVCICNSSNFFAIVAFARNYLNIGWLVIDISAWHFPFNYILTTKIDDTHTMGLLNKSFIMRELNEHKTKYGIHNNKWHVAQINWRYKNGKKDWKIFIFFWKEISTFLCMIKWTECNLENYNK